MLHSPDAARCEPTAEKVELAPTRVRPSRSAVWTRVVWRAVGTPPAPVEDLPSIARGDKELGKTVDRPETPGRLSARGSSQTLIAVQR